jgi:xanthine dehydrogenase YagR molybdenum-binding subunit
VIGILTHQNTPKFGRITVPLAGQTVVPLQDHRVHYEGQAVALVVADSLERATEAARLLQVFYSDAPFEADFLAASGGSGAGSLWHSAQPDQGQRSGSLVPGRREGRGHLSHRRSAPSRNRTRATLAVWQDGQLLVHDATQGVMDARTCLAQAVHLDPANVCVKCEFIGGGFGGKGWGLAVPDPPAMAARKLGCAVKLVLTRARSFTAHGHQPATRQTVALSARGRHTARDAP